MANLHVRNVPENLYERLRDQAQKENRSISAQVITLLDFALEEKDHSQAQVLENIRRRRFFNPTQAGAPDSLTLLKEDRNR